MQLTPALLAERRDAESWHARETDAVIESLDTDAIHGLTDDSVAIRLEQFGPNRISTAKPRTPWQRAAAQFTNPLIGLLLVAGAVSLLLDHGLDAAVIFAVVLVNAAIGFIQEGRAESALEAVRQMLPARAVVVRNGERRLVDAEALVPGDVVVLEAGSRIPADIRLLLANSLRVDESALTGESVPVGKSVAALDATTSLADRRCIAYSGTQVTNGSGKGVVVATGSATELGEIGTLVGDTTSLATPLTRRMDRLARQISVFIVALAAAVFGFAVVIHQLPPDEAFMAVVAMAVAGIPEGLPAVITIILAIAARALARCSAIVRRLPAVETLGSVSVICSDKTGTMTCNEMTVVSLVLPAATLTVTGSGYDPEGGVQRADGEPVTSDLEAQAGALAEAAALCNDAELREVNGSWRIVGDPTEGALLTFATKVGDADRARQRFPRIDEVPFASGNRFMATLHHDHHGHAFVVVKGAPERVAAMCDEPTEQWLAAAHRLAAAGQRVLAVARAEVPPTTTMLDEDHLPTGLAVIGLVGLQDPPRAETGVAIAECQRAGVTVKMITGDHARTACAIGQELGLTVGSTGVLEGADIDEMDDAALADRLADTDVIARASPANKLRIVTVLQAQDRFVAMTGDGANDAPALKAADIGVGMGKRGTDAAREASELVLADDNFSTIRDAVREGRVVYDNIKKTLLFMLPTSGGQALLVLAALMFDLAMPITVTQVLWVNMVTAVTLALALAFEPAEQGVMSQPPRPRDEPLLTRPLLVRIAFVSLLMLAVALATFEIELALGSSVEVARTAAATVLVLSEAVYLFNIRHFTASSINLPTLVGNRWAVALTALLIVLQLGFIYAGPMQQVFGTAALGLTTWALIAGLTAAKFLAVEGEKVLWRHRQVTRF